MGELGVLLEAKAVHAGRSARNHLLALAQTNGISRQPVDEVIDMVGLHGVASRRVGGSRWGWVSGWALHRRVLTQDNFKPAQRSQVGPLQGWHTQTGLAGD